MAESSKRLIKCRPTTYMSRDWQASRVRFTHNEIERKRRARLKSETDFLHQQLPRAVYRDKLAIFKAGTELLLRYADSNGPESRNLILTDSEYSACIFNNFDGFGLQVRCSDGMILNTIGNWQQSMGTVCPDPTGKTLYELIVPNDLTEAIITGNLALSSEERELLLTSGQSVARNFILPMASAQSSSPSEENTHLVECCGDIVVPQPTQADQKPAINEPLLQVVCRVLERPSGENGRLFTLRLQPDSHLILELSGCALPSGVSPADLIGQSLLDLATPAARPAAESNLQNAERTGEATFTICLVFPRSTPAQFRVTVKAITVCDYLHCLVADFYPLSQAAHSQ